MLPPQPAAQVLKAEAPAPDVRARAFALLSGPADGGWAALRLELRTAHAAADKRLGRLHPQTLTLRALAGLVLDRQGEARGLRLFAEACGDLHRRLRLIQRSRGAEDTATLPYLEALADLYRLEKLQDGRWEDQALRVHLHTSTGPRPDLERRVVAALERHYGPFLSFRAPDRTAVLEDVARLVSLWMRRTPPAERTTAFLEVALRTDARGCGSWSRPTRKNRCGRRCGSWWAASTPKLPRQADLGPFLAWLPAQAGAATPWADAARTLERRWRPRWRGRGGAGGCAAAAGAAGGGPGRAGAGGGDGQRGPPGIPRGPADPPGPGGGIGARHR